MKNKMILAVIVTLSMFSLSCSKDTITTPKEKEVRELTQFEKQLVQADNKFGLKLFRETVKYEPEKNIFISPLSVAMALGMTYNGANSETKTAMEITLELQGLTVQQINEAYKSLIELLTNLDPKVTFEIANSIWYREDFYVLPEFINTNQSYFNAVVSSLNFSSPETLSIINNWVKNATKGKIEKILDEIPADVVMYLINAIYFKGDWTYQFDKDKTEDALFYTSPGVTLPCKMMKQENSFLYFQNDDFQAIDLSYGDKDYSMTIFLPNPETEINLLISGMTQEHYTNWLGSFNETELTLFMPRFKCEYEIKLNDILVNLGMGIAFTGQADFTKINPDGDLFISEVKHKTFINVDEEGTEAAAVTSVGIIRTSFPPTMRLDKPFFFVIRENRSETILFMGKIIKPE